MISRLIAEVMVDDKTTRWWMDDAEVVHVREAHGGVEGSNDLIAIDASDMKNILVTIGAIAEEGRRGS